MQWKSEKCQGYERFAELDEEESATLNKKDTRAMMIAITKAKRKAVAGGDGSASRAKRARENRRPPAGMVRLFEADKTNQEIVEACAVRAKAQSDAVRLVQFRETVAEAEDPANGIEEQYHPKKESLFCWKALRAMSNAGHLDVFEFIEKTETEPTGSVVTAFKLLNDKEAGVDLKKMAAEAKKQAKARQAAEKAAKLAAERAAKAVAAAAAAKADTAKGADDDSDGDDGGKMKATTKKRKRGEEEAEQEEGLTGDAKKEKVQTSKNKKSRKDK